ncbi:hypothetical protein ILUMI_03521 [Ignelater luminosus]|uniref:Uncharacterized protein n=1 Tax=Ignelater luminosus TaxID=2038154 RepID=A0A8K0GM38_IGNLU|nr:hypothetical protein ILUMI_03521 [Ignelater luminosus]
MWDQQQFDKASVAERHRMCQELLASFDAKAVALLDPAALSNYKTLQAFYSQHSSTAADNAASEEVSGPSTSYPTSNSTVSAATENKSSRRQKQRAKKKAAKERAIVAIANAPRLADTTAAPNIADVVSVGVDAAAPGQTRSASAERDVVPPPASPGPTSYTVATYSEILQRPSSAMSCASATSQPPTEDPESDSEGGFTTVDGRNDNKQVVTNPEELGNIWKEYIEDLFDDERTGPQMNETQETILNILTSEATKAIKAAKIRKALSPDEIFIIPKEESDVKRVTNVMSVDCLLTVQEVAERLNINRETVCFILTEGLGMQDVARE